MSAQNGRRSLPSLESERVLAPHVERLKVAARLYAANQLEEVWDASRDDALLEAAIDYTTALYKVRGIRWKRRKRRSARYIGELVTEGVKGIR